MVRVYFPNLFMRLISYLPEMKPRPQAIFYIPPKMTKFEVKEYLTKIYNCDVLKVNTANYLGKWKRLYGRRRLIAYKRRSYKRAIVTLGDGKTTTDILPPGLATGYTSNFHRGYTAPHTPAAKVAKDSKDSKDSKDNKTEEVKV